MTKRQTPITPAEAAAVIGSIGGQRKSERKTAAVKRNAQSAGRTPTGYRIVKSRGRWMVWALGADGLPWPLVGDEAGYEHRRDAMDAAKAHKAESITGGAGH